MMRNNKWRLLVSTVVILLPLLVGVLFWNTLPEQIATHWGTDGNVDGWSHKGFAVFGLPLFMLAAHWVCVFFTARDPKNKEQNKKVSGMVLWICPFASLFAGGLIYATAWGKEFDVSAVSLLAIGVMFVVIGNYLPKCKQNYTIGIKVKWALEDEANWNATHRLGGKLWVVGGLLIAACMFLPQAAIPWTLIGILPIMAVIPVVYSYVYYKKHQ